MKKTVFATLVVAGVSVFVSCGHKSQVAPIDGSDCLTFTAKVDNQILKGVQNISGHRIKESVYDRVVYEHGFFIGTYPSYCEYDLFTADGKDVLPDLTKTLCVYSENVSDSLGHFVIQTGESLGVLDSQDVDLINKSDETMLDNVYAVREKK